MSEPELRAMPQADGARSTAEDDNAARLERVVEMAEQVFADRGRALRWLRAPHPELSGRAPLGVAESEGGARKVETILGQIAHGIPA